MLAKLRKHGGTNKGTLSLCESLHHGRRVGEEEKMKIRMVSGETNSILHIETYPL